MTEKSTITGKRLRMARELKYGTQENLVEEKNEFPTKDVSTLRRWEGDIPDKRIEEVALFFELESWVFTDPRLSDNQFISLVSSPGSLGYIKQEINENPKGLKENTATLGIVEELNIFEEERVIGSQVPLGKLFVSPKGTYFKEKEESGAKIDDVLEWIKKRLIQQQKFLLILGSFGSGKSSLVKYLTAVLSQEYTEGNPLPLYLPLKELDHPSTDLKLTVENLLSRWISTTDFDSFWNEQKWILFCDGFDELGNAYQNTPQWVEEQLRFLERLSRKPNFQVIVTSRPLLALNLSQQKKTLVLYDRMLLHPFYDSQIEQWLKNWNIIEPSPISFHFLQKNNLLEVTRSPLFLFFLTKVFDRESLERHSYTKSMIYDRFLAWSIKEEERGEDSEESKHKIPANYRKILQEVAWLIFTHPQSSLYNWKNPGSIPNETNGMIQYEVALKELEEGEVKRYLRSSESWNKNLFVAYAFREKKKEYIEFIHPSLREYLVAEKLFEVFFRLKEEEKSFAPQYTSIFSDRPVTHAKIEFFRDQVESQEKKDLKTLADQAYHTFLWPNLLTLCLDQSQQSVMEYERYQKKEEDFEPSKRKFYTSDHTNLGNLVLLSFLFEAYVNNQLKTDYSYDFGIKHLIYFFQSNAGYRVHLNLLKKSIGKLHWNNLTIKKIVFEGFQFTESVIKNCEFQDCRFEECDFSGVKIIGRKEEESFVDCDFDRISLERSEFQSVVFQNCRFKELKEEDTLKWDRVVFQGCQFFDSTFAMGWENRIQTNPGITKQILLKNCIQTEEGEWKFIP